MSKYRIASQIYHKYRLQLEYQSIKNITISKISQVLEYHKYVLRADWCSSVGPRNSTALTSYFIWSYSIVCPSVVLHHTLLSITSDSHPQKTTMMKTAHVLCHPLNLVGVCHLVLHHLKSLARNDKGMIM